MFIKRLLVVLTLILFAVAVGLAFLIPYTIEGNEFGTWLQTMFVTLKTDVPEPDYIKDGKDTRPYCKTVDEAANWVLSKMAPEETQVIGHLHEQSLGGLHFSYGLWIRNNIPVWGNEPLYKSIGKNVSGDDIGGMILYQYWKLARKQLPQYEQDRIAYFENTLATLKGSKPKGKTHLEVIRELNKQIEQAWPEDALFIPYRLIADANSDFTWEPAEMGEDLKSNIERFVICHSRYVFYENYNLRVGIPEAWRNVQ